MEACDFREFGFAICLFSKLKLPVHLFQMQMGERRSQMLLGNFKFFRIKKRFRDEGISFLNDTLIADGDGYKSSSFRIDLVSYDPSGLQVQIDQLKKLC